MVAPRQLDRKFPHMKTYWLGAAAVAALLAAGSAAAQPKAAPTAAAPAQDLSKAARLGSWGFDLSGRDTSVTPGQDFFQYANGGYVKALVFFVVCFCFGVF